MRKIIYTLGGHPLPGVLAVLVAGAAILACEYLRLSVSTRRRPANLVFVQRIAVATTIISVLLILSRFGAVEKL